MYLEEITLSEEDVFNQDVLSNLKEKEEIICGICQNIILEPYSCSKCHKSFCKDCILRWKSINNLCPYRCKSKFEPSKRVRKVLSVLKFKCKNGCEENIDYSNIQEHYKKSCKVIQQKFESSPQNNKKQKEETLFIEGNKYVGHVVNKKPEGFGKCDYLTGAQYIGEWKNGLFHGNGTYIYSNGAKQTGSFEEGVCNGKCTIIYPNGAKYEGNVKDGILDGFGVYIYPDGDKYEGEYKKGQKHGLGTYSYSDGSKYVGRYEKGQMYGFCNYFFPNGEKYVGRIQNGKWNGQGTYFYADGSKKSGIWKDGKFFL